jgi:hypothetical protein
VKYQLVLQWPTSWLMGYNQLVGIEELLIKWLGELGDVDGHDIGSGEMNIFIFSDNPSAAFDRALDLLKRRRGIRKLRAGYRGLEDDEYTPIYPEGLKHFCLI